MPLIPALGRQRQADFCVGGQPGLQSEFQDSQSYTKKPCLEKNKTKQQQQKNKKQKQKRREREMTNTVN
jgi:iron-sulfur cluster repair protein YtfE (RIC family)